MRLLSGLADALLAFLLAGMVAMVFGNVVLRYLFNSGIVVSEELSRFFFVWLTFIGAVVAMRDGAHLGMDSLVVRLGRRGRIVCAVLSEIVILGCCVLLFLGTLRQHEINATTAAPVTGISMAWVFGITYVTAAGIGLHAVIKLLRIATGAIGDDELIEVAEAENPGHRGGRP